MTCFNEKFTPVPAHEMLSGPIIELIPWYLHQKSSCNLKRNKAEIKTTNKGR